MRLIAITLMASVLAGCAHQPVALSGWHLFGHSDAAKTKPKKNRPPRHAPGSTLPSVDLEKAPGLRDQYFVGGFARGAWVNWREGQLFAPVKRSHANSAIVYFYRTDSRWNREEVVAPNFFLNGKRIPSLINNQYYWLELPTGTYRLTISRPVGVLHFQKPKPVDFSVKAGETYYLKYEELSYKGAPDQQLGLLREGPIMQMPTRQGLTEISSTRLLVPGISFVAKS